MLHLLLKDYEDPSSITVVDIDDDNLVWFIGTEVPEPLDTIQDNGWALEPLDPILRKHYGVE